MLLCLMTTSYQTDQYIESLNTATASVSQALGAFEAWELVLLVCRHTTLPSQKLPGRNKESATNQVRTKGAESETCCTNLYKDLALCCHVAGVRCELA